MADGGEGELEPDHLSGPEPLGLLGLSLSKHSAVMLLHLN